MDVKYFTRVNSKAFFERHCIVEGQISSVIGIDDYTVAVRSGSVNLLNP